LGRFRPHAHVLHHGGARPVARPFHQPGDVTRGPLEDRLDAAVWQVPHPAAHAVPLGHLAARVAEEHALHATRDQHTVTNHRDTVRRPDVVTRSACGCRDAAAGNQIALTPMNATAVPAANLYRVVGYDGSP